jgi:ABC-2 type transport system permease protein
VLRAKIITHLLSASIPCLFAAICFGFALAGSLADWLLLLILPQTAILALAVLGLTLNLHFPKLDWTNEIYVVKQGVSAMLSLFGSWGALIALGLLYAFALNGVLSITAYLWFCGLIFVVAGVCVYLWLMKRGAKKFVEL